MNMSDDSGAWVKESKYAQLQLDGCTGTLFFRIKVAHRLEIKKGLATKNRSDDGNTVGLHQKKISKNWARKDLGLLGNAGIIDCTDGIFGRINLLRSQCERRENSESAASGATLVDSLLKSGQSRKLRVYRPGYNLARRTFAQQP